MKLILGFVIAAVAAFALLVPQTYAAGAASEEGDEYLSQANADQQNVIIVPDEPASGHDLVLED